MRILLALLITCLSASAAGPMQTVDLVSGLDNLTPSSRTTYRTLGVTSVGDLELTWYWEAGATNEASAICRTNSNASGRFKTIGFDGNIIAFGAVGDDSTDNTTAWAAAVNYALSSAGNRILRVPAGTFLADTFDVTYASAGSSSNDFVKILGLGPQTSILKVTGTNNGVVFSGRELEISGVSITASAARQALKVATGSTNGNGVFLYRGLSSSQSRVVIRDTIIENQPRSGVYTDSPELHLYQNVDLNSNGFSGLVISKDLAPPWNNTFINVRAKANGAYGGYVCGSQGTWINFEALDNPLGGLFFWSSDSRNNTFINPDLENQSYREPTATLSSSSVGFLNSSGEIYLTSGTFAAFTNVTHVIVSGAATDANNKVWPVSTINSTNLVLDTVEQPKVTTEAPGASVTIYGFNNGYAAILRGQGHKVIGGHSSATLGWNLRECNGVTLDYHTVYNGSTNYTLPYAYWIQPTLSSNNLLRVNGLIFTGVDSTWNTNAFNSVSDGPGQNGSYWNGDPVSFGAGGDGTTDDTVALQAAFDYSVSSGLPVVLPPGRTYRVTTNLVVKSGLYFRNAGSWLLRDYNSDKPNAVFTTENATFGVRDEVWTASNTNIVLENPWIKYDTGVTGPGIFLDRVQYVRVIAPKIRGNGGHDDWALAVRGYDGTIIAPDIDTTGNIHQDGIDIWGGSRWSIIGGNIRSGDDSIAIGSAYNDNISDISVAGVTVYSSHGHGIRTIITTNTVTWDGTAPTSIVENITFSSVNGSGGVTRNGPIWIGEDYIDPTTVKPLRRLRNITLSGVNFSGQNTDPASTNGWGIQLYGGENITLRDVNIGRAPRSGLVIVDGKDYLFSGLSLQTPYSDSSTYPLVRLREHTGGTPATNWSHTNIVFENCKFYNTNTLNAIIDVAGVDGLTVENSRFENLSAVPFLNFRTNTLGFHYAYNVRSRNNEFYWAGGSTVSAHYFQSTAVDNILLAGNSYHGANLSAVGNESYLTGRNATLLDINKIYSSETPAIVLNQYNSGPILTASRTDTSDSLHVQGVNNRMFLTTTDGYLMFGNNTVQTNNKSFILEGIDFLATTASKPLYLMAYVSTTNNTTIAYGGGDSSHYATMYHDFYTAPNPYTPTGTRVFRLQSDGAVITSGSNLYLGGVARSTWPTEYTAFWPDLTNAIVAGANVTLAYDTGAETITISASGGGGSVTNGVFIDSVAVPDANFQSNNSITFPVSGTNVAAHVTDRDFGDITFSSSGTMAAIDTGAVTSAKILDGTVTGTDIAATTVALGNLAGDSVNSSKIVDGSIASADLGASSVVSNTIAAANVTSDKLANTGVSAGSYTYSSITVNAQGQITSASSGSPTGNWILRNTNRVSILGDTTETHVANLTIPANTLNNAGDEVTIHVPGKFINLGTGGTNGYTWRLYVDSSVTEVLYGNLTNAFGLSSSYRALNWDVRLKRMETPTTLAIEVDHKIGAGAPVYDVTNAVIEQLVFDDSEAVSDVTANAIQIELTVQNFVNAANLGVVTWGYTAKKE